MIPYLALIFVPLVFMYVTTGFSIKKVSIKVTKFFKAIVRNKPLIHIGATKAIKTIYCVVLERILEIAYASG